MPFMIQYVSAELGPRTVMFGTAREAVEAAYSSVRYWGAATVSVYRRDPDRSFALIKTVNA